MERAPELIRSRTNPLVRRLRSLKGKSAAGVLALLEGVKLLEEALAAGVLIVEVAASPRAARSGRAAAVLRSLRERGVSIREVDERLLDSLSEVETSQGVLALARRPSFDEQSLFRATPLLVVAVGVQSPGNLGGLLRTAEAAGSTGAYLTEGTADPFSWKALRGSMGSAFRLPHVRGLSVEEVVGRLKARGIRLAGATPSGGMRYDEADWGRSVALLLGSEGTGLPAHVTAQLDLKVTIPVLGSVESLNVGVAAGILLFEAARQRRRDAQ